MKNTWLKALVQSNNYQTLRLTSFPYILRLSLVLSIQVPLTYPLSLPLAFCYSLIRESSLGTGSRLSPIAGFTCYPRLLSSIARLMRWNGLLHP